MENKIPAVVFFQRKARTAGNFSVEIIFDDVRQRLQSYIAATVCFSKYESLGFFKRLYNCVQAAGNQGVVNHVTGDVNYIGLLLSRKRTIHTILDCVFLNRSAGLKHRVLKLFWLTIPVRRSIFITAISASTKNEILRYTSCDPDKIIVIPVAISTQFTKFEKPFKKEKPVILQIGTAPNKNIPRLIEALTGISCRLVIVGKYEKIYEEMLKKSRLDYVYQWGLSENDMINKYREADIIAFASTYEGFGMPILEAQATGRPVITGNVFSMPEVAGDAACLVDPHSVQSIREGFLKIINDDAYREALLNRGFKNIHRFDADFIAQQYLSLYKKTASRRHA